MQLQYVEPSTELAVDTNMNLLCTVFSVLLTG